MYNHENIPAEWFTSRRQPRPSHYPPPMSRPVSKSFNRISDFIFPDSVHVRLRQEQQNQQQPVFRRYPRTENYSLPALNRSHLNQRDLIIVERLPVEELDNIDLLYREQYYQPNRQVRRRYSSVIDERRVPFNARPSTGLPNRSTTYRDRRKRHTTDNVYHSMLKSMLEEDEEQYTNDRSPNYTLSYRTTLDPITDSESMASIHHHHHQQQQPINDISLEEWKRQTHCRVPINGTIPIMTEHECSRQRQRSSSISTRDSSSDTDITERHPSTMNHTHYQQDSSFKTASTIWERLPSNSVHLRHQPDKFIPILPTSSVDTNNQEASSYSNNLLTPSPFDNVINHQINNQTSSQDGTHHVSLCLNDLYTTLFIDEDALNSTKTLSNNNNKKVIKTFIDRIIKRLQHFKRSLDTGLTHIRKRNTLVSGSTVTADYRSRTKNDSWVPLIDENKLVQPYFLIKPQTVLVLPNETAKFKCCFGGDSLPSIAWSHNDSRIPDVLGGATSSKYRTHKVHDIYYLDIGPITLRDNGQIKCTIMNRFGREEAIAQLFVVPSPADATPYITRPLDDVTIIEGQALQLSCSINGLQVTVNWFHNGKLISAITQVKSDYNDEKSIFTLSQCMRTDVGTVDCLVKNRFGEVRTSCRIEVVNDPEFDR